MPTFSCRNATRIQSAVVPFGKQNMLHLFAPVLLNYQKWNTKNTCNKQHWSLILTPKHSYINFTQIHRILRILSFFSPQKTQKRATAIYTRIASLSAKEAPRHATYNPYRESWHQKTRQFDNETCRGQWSLYILMPRAVVYQRTSFCFDSPPAADLFTYLLDTFPSRCLDLGLVKKKKRRNWLEVVISWYFSNWKEDIGTRRQTLESQLRMKWIK